MKTSLKLFLAVLLVAPGADSLLAATVVTLNPTMDALVTTGPSGNLSSSNYGGAGALAISAPGSPKGEFQSVIDFNLSTAKSTFDSIYGVGQWSIQSITLTLNATPNNSPTFFNTTTAGQFNISLMQNSSWTEGNGTPATPSATGINFNTLQSTYVTPGDQALGTFSFSGNTSGMNTFTLTRSSGVFSDLNSGGNLSLQLDAADSVISYLVNSENFSTSADRPLLTITVVPEPTTLAIGATGLVLLGGRQFRNRRKS